ncbi:MAG: hypothetical protein QW374_03505 [Candidatus Bathyarchaeia archaeon]|nr:hypothetical protein [Candidatus Bathyarchaeota archaeon]
MKPSLRSLDSSLTVNIISRLFIEDLANAKRPPILRSRLSLTYIYWIKVAIGLILGFIVASTRIPLLLGLSIAIFIYIALHYVLKWRIGEDRLEDMGGERKLVMEGIGSFFLAYIFASILFYTLLYPTQILYY